MKILHKILLTLFFIAPAAFAQREKPVAATQAEVNAGVVKDKYVSPYTGKNSTWAGGGGGGPTNGITSGSASNIVNALAGVVTNKTADSKNFIFSKAGTNDIKVIAENLPSLTVSNTATMGQISSDAGQFTTDSDGNLSATTIRVSNVSANDVTVAGGFFGDLVASNLTASSLVKSDANKKLSSIANGAGALTNDASGNLGYTPLWDGSSLVTGQFVKVAGSFQLSSTLNFYSATNLNIWDTPTNLFSGTLFQLGTNEWISTASDVHFTDYNNAPPVGIERWGQLTIVATGSITITNPVVWKSSDQTNSRTLASGDSACLALDVHIGKYTNFFYVPCH